MSAVIADVSVPLIPSTKPAIGFPKGLTKPQRRQLRRLLAGPIDFMDQKRFAEKGIEAVIFNPAENVARANVSWYSQIAVDGLAQVDAPRSSSLPLLTAAQERVLFTRFNYCRYRAEQVRQSINLKRFGLAKAIELLKWHDRSVELREQLAEYNLALVLAMAQRINASSVDFPELISEGNMALLRAIDKFDVGRGFKFSTYACRAMIKAFGRLGIKSTKYRNRFPVEFDPTFERSNHRELKAVEHEQDCASQVRRIFETNSAGLTAVERQIIGHRFALDGRPEAPPLTLEQVGKMVGLTKERVRQIQKAALAKLRDTLESTFLDANGSAQPAAATEPMLQLSAAE